MDLLSGECGCRSIFFYFRYDPQPLTPVAARLWRESGAGPVSGLPHEVTLV